MIIGRLRGELAAVGSDFVMVEVNGISYVAVAGAQLCARLMVGQTVELFVETRVSEAAITLYAFADDVERAWFVRLQDVPGVAGRSAMAIVDILSPVELMDALTMNDVTMLMRAKGVGRKLAERIVGELAGKPPPVGRMAISTLEPAYPDVKSDDAGRRLRNEAVSALVNLGYSHIHSAKSVRESLAVNPDLALESLVKTALGRMMS